MDQHMYGRSKRIRPNIGDSEDVTGTVGNPGGWCHPSKKKKVFKQKGVMSRSQHFQEAEKNKDSIN